ncbi:YgjV family protein [Neptuniibacter sp. QD37_11]|uniref:YgjV family protein n=1 Tax=Neptuniibacter sp. QD37_11 TaxID=3398209 RepID=UPI0039F5A8D9
MDYLQGLTLLEWGAMGVGVVSLLAMLKCTFDPGRKTIIWLSIGTYTYAAHFLLLGEIVGFVVNCVSATRNVVAYKMHKSKLVFFITVAIMLGLSAYFYNSPKDLWIMGANLCSSFSIVFLSDRYIKLGLVIAYIQSFIYSVLVGSLLACLIIFVLVAGLAKGYMKDRKLFTETTQ